MVFSYIGISEPVKLITRVIESSISKFRISNGVLSAPLKPGGVFGNDIEKCARFAAENNMAVYLTANDIIRKSDIIFTFLPDSAISGLAKSLGNHGIENKVFCHFSPAFDASVLDFGTTNTYISFYIPALPKHLSNADNMPPFVIEGYGERFDEVCTLMRKLEIPFLTVNPQEKMALVSAVNLIGDFRTDIENTARVLMKFALHSNPEAERIFERALSSDYLPVTYNPVDSSNTDFVEAQRKTLASIGIKDISSNVGAMLLSKLYSKPQTDESYSAIKSAALKLITK